MNLSSIRVATDRSLSSSRGRPPPLTTRSFATYMRRFHKQKESGRSSRQLPVLDR
jgi:hypothetical protein